MAEDLQVRSMTVPLTLADDDLYKAVIGSIRQVRAAARQAYAVLFTAQAAGAEIQMDAEGNVTVRPNNERAKVILEATFNKSGKAPAYQMRQYVLDDLCPTIRSFVWDDLRQRVWSRWQAKDPEFPRAGMGWLALQNVRGLAAFRNTGIGHPALVLRTDALQPHAVSLEWDRQLGPVSLRVGTLDPGRWFWWRRIVAGDVKHGTVILNERDGRLSLLVSYWRPTRRHELDQGRTLDIHLADDGQSLQLVGPDGATTRDRIELTEARDWCARLRHQQDAWERRRGATGSPRKPWGEPRRFRAIVEHQVRLTATRENGQRGRNHAWAKRIVTRAADWRCRSVQWSIPGKSELCGHPWSWSHFESVLRYKLEAIGGVLS